MPNKSKKAKKVQKKFVLDCTHPAEDKILDPSEFARTLTRRLKLAAKLETLAPTSVSRKRVSKSMFFQTFLSVKGT